MRRALAAALAICVATAELGEARAQDDTQQAMALFEAGAAMYEKARYDAAIEAFEAAYRLAARPGIQFSIAQAHKKQFLFDKNPAHLREALRHYREYVAKTPSGGRRAEAMESIAELEPYAAKVDMSQAAAAPVGKRPPRVSIASSTKGVEAELDGKLAPEVPYWWEVAPGKHRITLKAPGYFSEEIEIVALEDGIVPVSRDLREVPARLDLKSRGDAQISIDGRLIGATPLIKPLDLDPGVHFVSVSKSGYETWSDEVELKHGETKTITAPLAGTKQRFASYVTFAAAVGGVGVGAIFAGFAFREQTVAQGIEGLRATQNITQAQRIDYESHLAARETDKKVAGIALGGGAAAAITGFMLYVFDQPAIAREPVRRDDHPKPTLPSTPRPTREMEVSAVPVVGPGLIGGVLTARF